MWGTPAPNKNKLEKTGIAHGMGATGARLMTNSKTLCAHLFFVVPNNLFYGSERSLIALSFSLLFKKQGRKMMPLRAQRKELKRSLRVQRML